MEEFAFSDSLFAAERPRTRNGPDVSGYSAKLCEAQWFESRDVDARCRDDSERLTLHKFRGDAAYRARDYAAALGWYDACLSLVPLSNTAVRRDALEARSRCLSHVGRTDEALKTAHTLGTIATNTDHDCVVHALVAAIQRQAGHLQGELSALTRLTSLRPLDAWHWRRLAAIYQELSRCARGGEQCNGEQSHNGSDSHSNGGGSCGSGSSHNCDSHRPCDNSDPSTACGFQSCIHSDSHDASTCALPNVGDEAAKRMSENNKCVTDVCTKAAAAAAGDAESMELMSGSRAVTDEPERWRLYACACRVRARCRMCGEMRSWDYTERGTRGLENTRKVASAALQSIPVGFHPGQELRGSSEHHFRLGEKRRWGNDSDVHGRGVGGRPGDIGDDGRRITGDRRGS
ncbi:uncharacterized protein C8orf76 homolog isoform X2 [Lethenteron reissneri]|uniref:uncharacterized protein C8orf76 homolog isoform X2 n=1 Tax=Lethenteron reissneri TaxID=7753 RepID=UPI002AB67DCA|nr:uncharacterized protein C8orf76 homolog isoform X2 [Lethenteron reissneri]